MNSYFYFIFNKNDGRKVFQIPISGKYYVPGKPETIPAEVDAFITNVIKPIITNPKQRIVIVDRSSEGVGVNGFIQILHKAFGKPHVVFLNLMAEYDMQKAKIEVKKPALVNDADYHHVVIGGGMFMKFLSGDTYYRMCIKFKNTLWGTAPWAAQKALLLGEEQQRMIKMLSM